MRSRGKIVLRIISVSAVFILLVWPFPQSMYNRLTLALSDLLHFPLMLFVAWLVIDAVPPRMRKGYTYVITWFALILLIAVIEYLQPLWGRSAGMTDFIYGVCGASIPVFIYASHGWPARVFKRLIRILCLIIVLAVTVPVGLIVLDQIESRKQFPLLAGFESKREFGRWTLNDVEMSRTRMHVTSGGYAVEIGIRSSASEYPGFFLEDFPRDWSRISGLSVDIYWPAEEARSFCVRIDDQKINPPYSKRFQKSFVLHQGINRILIDREEMEMTPSGEILKLSDIRRIGFFYLKADKGDVLYIDSLALRLKD